jgi:myo-inositol-1-phosphate synthase
MTDKKVKLAVVGVGNCASSLIQGFFYYKEKYESTVNGLMHLDVGGYRPWDIEVVAAFDIDVRKVGKDVSAAIFAPPNCTKVFYPQVPSMGVKVMMGHVLDGVATHMQEYDPQESFLVADEEPVDIARALKDSGAEVMINYLPVGSEKAARFYAQQALEAGCAFVNCMPVFIASDEEWAKKFQEAGLPIVGDDVKSQVGATITHRVLASLFSERGVALDKTYQLNVGGNTDFLNMLERSRLKSKKISKTEAVQSSLKEPLPYCNIHIGPSDYVPWLNDNKICYIRMEGRLFGDVPMHLELKLSVEDSPNSGGCTIDAIRCAKLALERKIGGPLYSISAYVMKHPPIQYPDHEAKAMVEAFIKGDRER